MLCAFDCDGTLADSKSVYYKAVYLYSDQKGLKRPSPADMDLVIGNPAPPLIFDGWGELDAFKEHLNTIYLMSDRLICDQPSDMPLFDGIKELLEELERDGFMLSIVTSRSIKPVLALIEHHKISKFFKTIRSDQDIIDRGYRGKPHPDKLNCVLKEMAYPAEKSIMIGDTLMDMKMAKNAGAKAIGVLWGYHNEKLLRSHGADGIVKEPYQIRNVIRTL